MYVCMHAFIHVSMHVCACMYVCMYACTYVRTYVCICISICVCVCIQHKKYNVCMYTTPLCLPTYTYVIIIVIYIHTYTALSLYIYTHVNVLSALQTTIGPCVTPYIKQHRLTTSLRPNLNPKPTNIELKKVERLWCKLRSSNILNCYKDPPSITSTPDRRTTPEGLR